MDRKTSSKSPKTKVVNRTGKKIIQKALVVNAKNNKTAVDAEKIKKQNEELAKSKLTDKPNSDNQTSSKDQLGNGQTKTEERKPDKKFDLTIDAREMLKMGSHLGHKRSKTHPKAKDFIYATKDGIEVIDLTITMQKLQEAANFIYNAKRNGKQVVLVGTKRQAKEAVKRVAQDAGVPYVTDRWLGGTISNWEQIKKNIRRLIELKEGMERGDYNELTKKEQSLLRKEIIRLEKMVGGLVNLIELFDILFVVDAGFEKTAVKEAQGKGIPVVALVDTDSNPTKVDYAIPANDDNARSINLIVEEIGKAIKAAGVK